MRSYLMDWIDTIRERKGMFDNTAVVIQSLL